MKFYAYLGGDHLGKEPCGCGDRYNWEDLKTVKGAIRRARRYFRGRPFSLYSYTNFYDDRTFTPIVKGAVYAR